MSNGTSDPRDPWFDTHDQQNKEARRAAANAFLKKATENPDAPGSFRQRVRQSEAEAYKELNALYKEQTGRDIPPDVRVICLEPNLHERGKLVVLLLPTVKGDDPEAHPVGDTWEDAWIAAWQPYD